ncbi:MAG TPA: ATP-binding protein [Solirubrobacteraceae bacterium]|nr:ATP-binding protein [Solirubrobacteraceae bacterium]
MARGAHTYNPYTPDAGARPPALVGRDRELEHLQSIITQLGAGGTERHLLITGLRGVGKTVMLNEFENVCVETGWPAESKEVARDSSVAVLVGRSASRALRQLSLRAKVTDRLSRAMRVLTSFEVTLPGEIRFKLGVDALAGHADSGDLADDLRDVLVSVGEAAAEAGVGFALVLDELHNLAASEYEALIIALHRAKQKTLPVSFVAAGLPLIPALTGEAKTYAERMFVRAPLGALPDDAACIALADPARMQKVRWAEDALKLAVNYTEGYPYFLQEVGRWAWRQREGERITRPDVEAAIPLAEAELDESFFEVRLGRLNASQRAYVHAMAELGDGPVSSLDIAQRLGRKPTAVTKVRDALIREAVVYPPARGELAFTVPHCARFVRRRYG